MATIDRPVIGGIDTRELGRCLTSPGTLAWALTLSYEMAEWHARRGSLDSIDWALYRFYWRNSAPRFSSNAEAFALKVPR